MAAARGDALEEQKHEPGLILTIMGGGSKGAAYSSPLKKIAEQGDYDKIETVMGTSVGSIVGTLIAIGRSAQQVAGAMETYDPDNMDKMKGKTFLGKIGVLWGALMGEGLADEEEIRKFLAEQFRQENLDPNIRVGTFEAKRQTDIRAQGRSKLRKLMVPVTEINTAQTILISSDNPAFANMKLVDLVLASASFPWVFKDVKRLIDGKYYNFTDGGWYANDPSVLVPDVDRPRTIALRLRTVKKLIAYEPLPKASILGKVALFFNSKISAPPCVNPFKLEIDIPVAIKSTAKPSVWQRFGLELGGEIASNIAYENAKRAREEKAAAPKFDPDVDDTTTQWVEKIKREGQACLPALHEELKQQPHLFHSLVLLDAVIAVGNSWFSDSETYQSLIDALLKHAAQCEHFTAYQMTILIRRQLKLGYVHHCEAYLNANKARLVDLNHEGVFRKLRKLKNLCNLPPAEFALAKANVTRLISAANKEKIAKIPAANVVLFLKKLNKLMHIPNLPGVSELFNTGGSDIDPEILERIKTKVHDFLIDAKAILESLPGYQGLEVFLQPDAAFERIIESYEHADKEEAKQDDVSSSLNISNQLSEASASSSVSAVGSISGASSYSSQTSESLSSSFATSSSVSVEIHASSASQASASSAPNADRDDAIPLDEQLELITKEYETARANFPKNQAGLAKEIVDALLKHMDETDQELKRIKNLYIKSKAEFPQDVIKFHIEIYTNMQLFLKHPKMFDLGVALDSNRKFYRLATKSQELQKKYALVDYDVKAKNNLTSKLILMGGVCLLIAGLALLSFATAGVTLPLALQYAGIALTSVGASASLFSMAPISFFGKPLVKHGEEQLYRLDATVKQVVNSRGASARG